jgi:TonB-dependent starch-binding outer membrane protein SusC
MKKKENNYLTWHVSAWLKQLLIIMKISLLLFILGLGTLNAKVNSQTVKVDFSLQNVSLKAAINDIETKTDYKFLYRSDLVDMNKITSIETNETTIDKLMTSLLKNTHIGYNLLGEHLIVLRPSQQLKVSGTVTDATTGETLVGVNIVVKGSTIGVVSDAKGNFSVDLPDQNAVLVFSYVGYIAQEIPVAQQSTIEVKLAPEVQVINDVVVIGYGTQKKADLTGSLSVVSSKELANVAVLDPLQALQSKASGVNITSVSGQPGAGYQIRIRGVQSINASNNPIYVIDGVIAEDMNSISMYDIDNISILKDGASSAIYGARAANGVVLITTKQGSKNEAPVISFHTYQGIQTQPNTRLKLLNSDQWLKLYKESFTNDGYTGTDLTDNMGYTDTDLEIYKDASGHYRSTDWLKKIERTGNMGYYDLSVRGGSEKSTYFTSVNYLAQEGMIKSQSAKKINFRFNSQHTIRKFIEFGNTLNLFDDNNEGLPDFNAVNASYIPNPYLQAFRKSPLSEVTRPNGTYGINQNTNVEYQWAPPTVFTDLYKRKSSSYGVIGSLYAKFNLIKGLSFTPKVSLTYQHNLYSFYTPAISLENTSDVQAISSLQKNSSDQYHWQNDYMLNYDRTFNKHNISIVAAYTQETSGREELDGYRSGIPTNSIYYLTAGDPFTQINDNSYTSWAIASYIGRINYDYDGKYLLQATVRRDGVSRFSSNHRWGVFPSYSIGWRISKEKFFAGLTNVVNDLKLRASSGTLGNANIGSDYPTAFALTPGTAILNEQLSGGFKLDNAINLDVKWETTRKNNFGIDLSLLKSKFYVTVDYFISKTTNLLYQKPLPLSVGKNSAAYINGGKFQNKGWEFELGFREKRGDFSYDINANFTAMRNKVLDLAGQDSRPEGIAVGQPFRSYYGLTTDGIVKTQAQLTAYKALSPDAELGDVMFKDINGVDANGKLTGKPDGVIDAADYTFIGKKYPDLTYGFVANVSYKRLSLQIQTQGLKGMDLPFRGITLSYFGGTPENASDVLLQRYQTTENPGGNLPRLTLNDPNGNQTFSDIWLSNASYFKISNINLSFNLPENISKRLHLKDLTVYCSVQNLYTFTKWKGGDPDVAFGGNDYISGNPADKVPQPRTWIIGLKLSL